MFFEKERAAEPGERCSTCSGNGACDQSTGKCTCKDGFVTRNCAFTKEEAREV